MLNGAQLAKLEPEAAEAFCWMARGTGTSEVALVSIAISLRRIADAMNPGDAAPSRGQST